MKKGMTLYQGRIGLCIIAIIICLLVIWNENRDCNSDTDISKLAIYEQSAPTIVYVTLEQPQTIRGRIWCWDTMMKIKLDNESSNPETIYFDMFKIKNQTNPNIENEYRDGFEYKIKYYPYVFNISFIRDLKARFSNGELENNQIFCNIRTDTTSTKTNIKYQMINDHDINWLTDILAYEYIDTNTILPVNHIYIHTDFDMECDYRVTMLATSNTPEQLDWVCKYRNFYQNSNVMDKDENILWAIRHEFEHNLFQAVTAPILRV